MSELVQEIDRRRTFAIISHPDAGKTTLSEKLLLYGGAIQKAGMITKKANREQTVSDWMEIERSRGISITSSALQFEWKNIVFNLLDTPGHQDFSEDTYRTLMAVDSAIMLLDCVKGVEPQTIKLFKVCRDRGIPVFTFINKMDRPGKNPFELLDEVEEVLNIVAVPKYWPIGEPGGFKGIYERGSGQVHLFERTAGGQWKAPVKSGGLDDPALKESMSANDYDLLCEEMEMVDGVIPDLDEELFLEGEMTPVFFGCAINNFGLENFLDHFADMAPKPAALKTADGDVSPETKQFTGFIYKVQANMNKAHRDRMAFMRVATGKFEKNMTVKHQRSGKKVKLSFPYRLFGQRRDVVEEAWPGDIVGLVNPGLFKVGDVLSTGPGVSMQPFPRFPPEIFARVTLLDMMQNKSFRKGITQLGEEGVVLLLRDPKSVVKMPVLGVVGQLQLEVFQDRMLNEYNAEVRLDHLEFTVSRWLDRDIDNPGRYSFTLMYDEFEQPVALFRNEWHLNQVAGEAGDDLKFLPHPPDPATVGS